MLKVLTSKNISESFRLYGYRTATAVLLLVLCIVLSSCGGTTGRFTTEAKKSIMTLDPNMGDWQGSWKLSDGSDSGPLVAQVIALGEGKYEAKFREAFDTEKKTNPIAKLDGELKDGTVNFGENAKIEDGKFTGTYTADNAEKNFTLKRVFRISPTMGAKPPKGAIVLFERR